ncbi:hypothetical protein AOLI_G00256650 [Acnodon oligacanthus]
MNNVEVFEFEQCYNDVFCTVVEALRQLVDVARPDLARVEDVVARLGMRSLRVVAQLFEGWRSALSPEERKQVRDYSAGVVGPSEHDPFPDISITPEAPFWSVREGL